MGKTCQICGKPSGMYPLCKEHANGKTAKCEKCGMWYEIKNGCQNCKKTDKKENNLGHSCSICGKQTPNKNLCNDCYKRVDIQSEEINKNVTPMALRDYYYNLKNYIFRSEISNEEIFHNQLAKLYTLADLTKRLFNRDSLLNKVFDDIKEIKESKAKVPQKEISDKERVEKNINTAGVNRTKDGHFVKSEYEVTVDDILFDLSEVHVYEKIVAKITERTVVCDWYIPIYRNNGIYIELWGIDKDYKYNLNKEEKRTLYKKHNLPLIEIEKDELKGDTLGLSSRIESELIKYKNKIKEEI